MKPDPSKRPFDVVVWGATGHTGRLVAEELLKGASQGEGTIRWAIAGRSEERLEEVRRHLASIDESAAEVPILVGDSTDSASLAALADQTAVVCSTVGPFSLHGSQLVSACVERGTDYCDTTGEVGWVREMIAAHHDEARDGGVRIVPFCGVDSVPSDLGCLMLHDHFQSTDGARLSSAHCLVEAWRGGYSGGTYASMLEGWIRMARDPAARASFADPYSLNSEGCRAGPDGPEGLAPRWDAERGCWTGMFLMSGVNTRVVRRTRELLGDAYADSFSYREERAFGRGLGGWFRASWEAFRWVAVMVGAMAPPSRWLVRRLVPSPGEGPGPEDRQRGRFAFAIHATGETPAGEPARAVGRVGAEVDTYGVTAMVAAEAAALLAGAGMKIPERGGVLTPAAALGMPLVEGLRRAGMVFDVEPAAASVSRPQR